MNPFTIIGLSISILCFTLAIIIFIYGKDRIHFLWAFFNLALFGWSLCLYFVGISKTPQNAILAWRYVYVFGSFATLIFYHFIYSFCDLKKSNYLRINYFIGLIFVFICCFAPNFIKKVNYIFNSIYYNDASLLFNILMIYVSTILFLSFLELINYIKKAKGNKLKQGTYILYVFGLGWGGGISTFLPSYNLLIYPIWHLSICIYILIMTYAIFKHQIMDINIVIRKSLIYSSLVTVMTIIFLISVFISERLFNNVIHYQNITISIITASLIALIFTPLKNIIQDFVDRAFFKATHMEMAQQNELLHQEVTQSERMKSIAILASGMAHEIKNPLTPIKTFSEQLPKRLDDKEFLLKFSKIINHEVDRIDNLVQDLLDFAKPSLPQLKSVNIQQLIEQTLDLLNNEIIRHKINLNTSFENANLLINIDPQQIKQALLNIYLNAIDAMPNGGTLTINSKINESNNLIISITDTGHGIDPKDFAHIFDPFFTKKDHGTGLGLSITYEIIKNHNGRIFADSELGRGTTFRIELPV